MSQESTYSGSCFCGAVELTVRGAPVGMGFCHCASCRSWSAAPVSAFALWPRDAMRITKGEASLGRYSKTPQSSRTWCTRCGGHILTELPALGLVDLYPATIPDFPFEPGLHIHYQETALRMRDGLPKMRDVPAEMSGSGEILAE
jgi:hypothetical protein